MGYKITIDGPSGSGKGFLADAVSKKLHILNIDTGAMYRAFTLYCLENNVDLSKDECVEEALKNVKISFEFNEGLPKIYLNNEDVSYKIRTEEIGLISSKVSSNPIVRKYMVECQRKMADKSSVVMEGRDIGSVVFKEAELKIFLTADIYVRAKRRLKDLLDKNINTTLEEVIEILKQRDEADYNKKISPLIKTEDMIEIDTTNLSKEEVVNKVIELATKKGLVEFENV